MGIKQIAKMFILKDCGIITAICFILTCFGVLLLNTLQPTFFRFFWLIVLYILLIVTLFCTRVKYLSGLIGYQNYDCLEGAKLLVFNIVYFCIMGIIGIIEFVLFAFLKGYWHVFYIFLVLTVVFFVVIFFSYIGISELEYLKKGIAFKEFLKVDKFNKKYPTEMLAKFAGIALVQFVLGLCLVFGLIKYCATPWLFGISIAGSYITSFAILKLEGLKIYYYELIKPKH